MVERTWGCESHITGGDSVSVDIFEEQRNRESKEELCPFVPLLFGTFSRSETCPGGSSRS